MDAATPTSPDRLIEELGITEPAEIDIEAIAQYCGATIVYEPLRGCEARLVGYGNSAIITANSGSPRGRQRFSAAHELGHWVYDRGEIVHVSTAESIVSGWSHDALDPERRANKYAVGLLLPEALFAPQAQRFSEMNFESVRALSDEFQTSLTATAIRFVELGPLPAMLVCLGSQGRRWFRRGPDVPDKLWPRKMPGDSTSARKLLHEPDSRYESHEVDADEWLKHPDSHRYTVMEESVRIPGRQVLSLIWWKDERQLLDLMNDVS